MSDDTGESFTERLYELRGRRLRHKPTVLSEMKKREEELIERSKRAAKLRGDGSDVPPKPGEVAMGDSAEIEPVPETEEPPTGQ